MKSTVLSKIIVSLYDTEQIIYHEKSTTVLLSRDKEFQLTAHLKVPNIQLHQNEKTESYFFSMKRI